MTGFTVDDAASLLGLLGSELEILEQIRKLTDDQTELIARDDIDAFSLSLDSRQELIEKINGLHQESDVLMQSYMSNSGSGHGIKTQGIEDAVERIRDVIAECAELNDRNMDAAKERAEEYISRIGKLSLNRKSFGAYIQDVENKPEMFDKKM